MKDTPAPTLAPTPTLDEVLSLAARLEDYQRLYGEDRAFNATDEWDLKHEQLPRIPAMLRGLAAENARLKKELAYFVHRTDHIGDGAWCGKCSDLLDAKNGVRHE